MPHNAGRVIDSNGVVIHDNADIPELTTPKDPDEVLDYRIAWGDWLQLGESISSRQWITDGNFTIDSNSQVDEEAIGLKTYTDIEVVWLSGGLDNTTGLITCRVTTNQGRTADRSFRLRCQTR